MGFLAIKLRITPETADTDIEELKKNIETNITEIGGKINSIEEEEIAFGLKALIPVIQWPEEKDTDLIEPAIQKTKEIGSVQITNITRAL